MKLNRTSYEKLFKGFYILDCVVRRRDFCYFIIEQEQEYDDESDTPPKNKALTRVITYVTQPEKVKAGKIWGGQDLTGMHYLKAGVSYQPKEQFVGVSLNDHVYVLGSGDDELENDLEGGRAATGKDIGMRGGISKSRTIEGWLWIAGSGRTVGRRLGRNQWEWHDVIPYKSLMDDGGFLDIDGFSLTDIYAVGGHGDVWHYNGAKWKQLPFPSNMTLEAVCCAGDGQVYIGAESGTVFKGRDNKWKLISRGSMSIPFKDMVWYQDKVWCTSDYGLWTIENDKLKDADVPDKVRVRAGNLSVGDGVMLLAGAYGAALHDGREWKTIIDYSDLAE